MHILVICSQSAGGKKWISPLQNIQNQLQQLQIPFFCVDFSGNSTDLCCEEIFQNFGFDTVLVAGGDGTLRRVLQAMFVQNRTEKIVFFPCGSANIFGQMHGLSQNLDFLQNPSEKKIDIGVLNKTEIFLIAAVFGKAAKFSLDAHFLGKKFFGFFAYIVSALLSLFFPFRAKIVVNHKKYAINSFLVFLPDFSAWCLPSAFHHSHDFLSVFLKDKTFLGLSHTLSEIFVWQKIPKKYAAITTEKKLQVQGNFQKLIHLDGDQMENIHHEKKFVIEHKKERFVLLISQNL